MPTLKYFNSLYPEIMEPTIGRIVHYNTTEYQKTMMATNASLGSKQNVLAAIITSVDDQGKVNLHVLLDGGSAGFMFVRGVEQGTKEGQWSWPMYLKPKEEAKEEAKETEVKTGSPKKSKAQSGTEASDENVNGTSEKEKFQLKPVLDEEAIPVDNIAASGPEIV